MTDALEHVGYITPGGRLLGLDWPDRRPTKGREKVSPEKWMEGWEPVYRIAHGESLPIASGSLRDEEVAL